MQSVTKETFGPLIAYLIPGATVLFGFRPWVPAIQTWFANNPADAPTLGGFLYLTVAALAVGMTVSAVRWAVIDTVHAWTGLPAPELDFGKLGGKAESYRLLIEIHYTYYRFNANQMVAIGVAWAAHRAWVGWLVPPGWADLGVVVLAPIFFVTSRDNLRKYFTRTAQLLGGGATSRRSPSQGAGRTRGGTRVAPREPTGVE